MAIIPPAPTNFTWSQLMDLALQEANQAYLENEVPVGALIISPQGNILAQAHNKTRQDCDPTAHAEILCLRKVAQVTQNYRLNNLIMVVTLEPCLMCLGAIREARIAGIVFGVCDTRSGCVCSVLEGCELPTVTTKPWYMSGIKQAECQSILQNFFMQKRLSFPTK